MITAPCTAPKYIWAPCKAPHDEVLTLRALYIAVKQPRNNLLNSLRLGLLNFPEKLYKVLELKL